MTNREIFERVKNHLMAQGGPAHNEDGECQYLAPNGAQCAVGCLIESQAYSRGMEGAGMAYIRIDDDRWNTRCDDENQSLLARALNESNIPATQSTLAMLRDLQSYHDDMGVVSPGMIGEELDALAKVNAESWGLA